MLIIQLNQTEKAIEDCSQAVELDSTYLKAYIKRARWLVSLKTQRLLICPYSHRDERGCALLGASTLARNNALAWADSNYCCHLFVHLSREIISLQLFLSLLSRSDPAIAQTRRKECARGFSRIFQTPSISYGC